MFTGVNVVSVTAVTLRQYRKMAGDVTGKFYYRRFCNNYAVFFGISCHIYCITKYQTEMIQVIS